MNVRSTPLSSNRAIACDPVRLLAGDRPGQVDRIDPDVPDRAAAHPRVDPRVPGVFEQEGERPADQLECAKLAALRDLDRPPVLWMVEGHERLGGDPAGPPLASMMASISATLRAIGFSHRTCLPALSARMVHGACRWFGSEM